MLVNTFNNILTSTLFRLDHTCFAESTIAIKLDDSRTFQGVYSILAKFKDFQGLENEAIFFKDFQGCGNPGNS